MSYRIICYFKKLNFNLNFCLYHLNFKNSSVLKSIYQQFLKIELKKIVLSKTYLKIDLKIKGIKKAHYMGLIDFN